MTWRVVAQTSELEEDLPLPVDVVTDAGEEFEVAIVSHEGEYFAIHNECSHGKVALSDGDVEDCTIECYLHGSRFDLRTGAVLNLPATQPVPVYPVRLNGDDLEVDADNPLPVA
ncbi:non-heme iron oxygenase ferredoxin subunit [Propionibacteriaceae bacterium Y1923]|uniref:non-heme iron oxygenase ferredoxin subunit n=1 Tax=Aestuariimicrobium sp. Y1814 TaxID=3418742 RepID=UPI003C133425